MMPVDDDSAAGFSLRRWSRRKLAAAREAPSTTRPPVTGAPPADAARSDAAGAGEPPAANTVPGPTGIPAHQPPGAAAEPLAPVESLSFESDFRPYLQPKVDESLRRQALRRLFEDPHFNVMDGLDIYVGDYSQPDPIPPEMLRQIVHARALLEPVTTRINAQGEVEMVVPDTAEPMRRAEGAADRGEAAPAVPAAATEAPTTAAAEAHAATTATEAPTAAAAGERASAAPPVPHAAPPWSAATPDPRDDAVPVARRDDDDSPR
jgi:hypothetical protein